MFIDKIGKPFDLCTISLIFISWVAFFLVILTKSGFGGEGLLSGLKIIRSKQWFGSEQFPTYLSTHPASEERIVNLANWIEMEGDSVPELKKAHRTSNGRRSFLLEATRP